jgi:hypothetical protein
MASTLPKRERDDGRERTGQVVTLDPPLRISEDGLARLRERLEAANRDNPDFAVQYEHLMAVVLHALDLLRTHELAPQIELVLAAGEWARNGIDLRTLPETEEVYLELVVRLDAREYEFDTRISAEVFAVVNDGTFFFHLDLITLGQWEHALEHLRSTGRSADLIGIPLLVRA